MLYTNTNTITVIYGMQASAPDCLQGKKEKDGKKEKMKRKKRMELAKEGNENAGGREEVPRKDKRNRLQ